MCSILVVTMTQVDAIIRGRQASRRGEYGSVKPTAKAVVMNSSDSKIVGGGRRLMAGEADGQSGLRLIL